MDGYGEEGVRHRRNVKGGRYEVGRREERKAEIKGGYKTTA